MLDQDLLLAAIDAGRSDSYGSELNSDLGQVRAKAIEAYLGLNNNPAPEGRSQVVDRSVYETISTLMPSLVRIFAASSEEVCKFLPVGPDDEAAAEQTTAVINHVVTQDNNWEQIAGDWIHDAMLLSNGYAMAYWDKTDRSIRELYEGQTEDQIAALLQDTTVRVVQHSKRPDKQGNAEAAEKYKKMVQKRDEHIQQQQAQYQQAAQQAQAQGQPPPPPPQEIPEFPKPPPLFLHDVMIERPENDGKVCLSVLAPEHCRIARSTPDWTLKQCDYFEYRQLKTIADLRASGLDVPDDVSDDETVPSEEDYSRDRFNETTNGLNQGLEAPGVMRQVWASMIWVRANCEGDDVSRLYQVMAVGREILDAQPVARIPVASLTPQPLPHRHVGMSVAETVIDIQDTKTAVKRGGLDNLYLANNGRHVISSQVNLADFLDARPGGVVRMLTDALPSDGHVMPLVHPVAFDSIIGSLEYFDQERQNRTGASRYFSGTDANAINKTASGTIALQNMASMRVEHIARVMAPAVEYLFECVHEIVSKHQNKALTLKLKGQWTAVDPQAWRTKRDVKISVGVGAGNRESMMGQLTNIFQAQMQIGGMGLAGPNEVHATVIEMAKLAGFSNPNKFWVDPTGKPPQPTPPTPDQVKAQASMQELQFKAQQDAQKFQAEQQHEQAKMQMQVEVDKQREEMQARQKMLESQQDAQLEAMKADYAARQAQAELEFNRWKVELEQTVKLQIAQMAHEAKEPPEDDGKAELMQMVQQIAQSMQEMNAPATIIRDQAGRAVGVQRGSRTQTLVRDQQGRADGLQ